MAHRTWFVLALALFVSLVIGVSSALAATPTVTGFTPDSGPSGWFVTLTGTDFAMASNVVFTPTDVTYSPKDAASFVVQNDDQIVATVPFLAAVPLSTWVTVQTPDGSASTLGTFAIDGQLALSEHRGSSGETVTLTGSGFTAVTKVTLGTWPTGTTGPFALANPRSASFHVLSDSKVTVTVPTLPAGTRSCVEVTSPTATSVSPEASPFVVVKPHLLYVALGRRFAVRPRNVVPSVDGAFSIQHVRWHIWRTSRSYGTGTVWIDNGIPTMAHGTIFRHAGSVTGSRVRGGLYTRMTIHWYVHRHTLIRRFSLKKAANGAGWYWA